MLAKQPNCALDGAEHAKVARVSIPITREERLQECPVVCCVMCGQLCDQNGAAALLRNLNGCVTHQELMESSRNDSFRHLPWPGRSAATVLSPSSHCGPIDGDLGFEDFHFPQLVVDRYCCNLADGTARIDSD
jgi:hypothetical protein